MDQRVVRCKLSLDGRLSWEHCLHLPACAPHDQFAAVCVCACVCACARSGYTGGARTSLHLLHALLEGQQRLHLRSARLQLRLKPTARSHHVLHMHLERSIT